MPGQMRGNYPELMSEKELAKCFRDLDARMEQELFTCLRDSGKRIEILENLMESDHTQYRCAILLMLSRRADMMNPDRRLFLLPYLLDLLSDESGSVRLGAQDCAGHFIAMGYEQDPVIWSQSLRKILFDGRGSAPGERIRKGNALSGLLRTVLGNVPEKYKKGVLSVYGGYFKSTKWDRISCVSLLKGIFDLPYKAWGSMQRGNILGFVRYFLKNDTGEVRLASLILLDRWLQQGWKPSRDFAGYLCNALEGAKEQTAGQRGASAIRCLTEQIRKQVRARQGAAADRSRNISGDISGKCCDVISDHLFDRIFGGPGAEAEVLYRENLDSGVPALVKHVNLQILRTAVRRSACFTGAENKTADENTADEKTAETNTAEAKTASYTDADTHLSAYGAHLLVFMRLNTDETLFMQAGEDLLQIMDQLADHQKQEIMTELFKCAELEDDSSHYLPYLIGQCWFRIPAVMQQELIPEMQRLCNSERPEVVEIVLGAACEILGHLAGPDAACEIPGHPAGPDAACEIPGHPAVPDGENYIFVEKENEVIRERREAARIVRRRMSGMLCQGIYSDRRQVAENSVYTIGCDLFRNLRGSGAHGCGTRDCHGERMDPSTQKKDRMPGSSAREREKMQGLTAQKRTEMQGLTAQERTEMQGLSVQERIETKDPSGRKEFDAEREPLVSVARSILLYMQAAERPDPLYRYMTVHEIARYLTEIGHSYEDPKRPVAFFSDSFDPFSNGHRAVAREIAEMGFQVYVNVDDFSWDRNTQPLAMRRKIAMLSIADLEHVRIFPQNIIINQDNPADLERLCALFPGQKVYLVSGSDRIAAGEAYRRSPAEGSVRSFPHIVYTRKMSPGAEFYDREAAEDTADLSAPSGIEPEVLSGTEIMDPAGGTAAVSGTYPAVGTDQVSGTYPAPGRNTASGTGSLTGEVICLRLPIYYEHMTSVQIRSLLQEGKKIDDLVTIPARQYIRRHKLYADERIYKKEIETKHIGTSVKTEGAAVTVTLTLAPSGEVTGTLSAVICGGEIPAGSGTLPGRRCGEEMPAGSSTAGTDDEKPPAGSGAGRQAPAERPFRDIEIIGLSCSCTGDAAEDDGRTGMLLDEALLAFQADGFEMVYIAGNLCDVRLLRERGFVRIQGEKGRYSVDLRSPLVLFGNASSCVLEPFAEEPSLIHVMKENERALRLGIAGLYPGNAVLFLDGSILNDRLARRIRARSGQAGEKEETDWICVPFGKILKFVQIPGVVTMALNTEKVYTPDLESFSIREGAGYPDLSVQIGTLKSMDRPFVLVDDFYHNGYRMEKIARSLRDQSLREEELIVGAVSAKGRAVAARNGLRVDAVYEIPNMKVWILETDMIPFYGGDRVQMQDASAAPETDMGYPAIYPILPWQMPSFLKDAPYQAVYDLSMICLTNARRLFLALEKCYEKRCFHRLTLEHLGEIIDDPGFPETAVQSPAARNQTASELLAQEITRLKRFHARRV